MGRPPLDKQTEKALMTRLITATQALVFEEGLDRVTIRAIARRAGMNSTTLYKYFRDLDELLLFACIDIFKSYSEDLARSAAGNAGAAPEETYLLTWRLFCRHAFRYPECMNHLFFSRHSPRLVNVVQTYYDLFPEELEGISDCLRIMVRSSSLYVRNLAVLRPVLEGRVSEERLNLLNELTVAYFRMLLTEKLADPAAVDGDAQTERMLAACRLLIAADSADR